MEAKKLKFILKRAGLKYWQFAHLIGKSTPTIQRWMSENQYIGEIYTPILEKELTPKIFEKLEKDWEEYKKTRSWR